MPTPDGRIVFVLGAGADAPLGLPTAAALLGEVARFAKGDGSKIEKTLRKKLGRLVFSFDRLTGEHGETFGERLLSSHAHLIPQLKSALSKHPNQQSDKVVAMRKLVDSLDAIRQNNQLDDDTVRALADLAGEESDVSGGDTLLNPRGLNLTHIPRMALRKTFQGALGEIRDLTGDEREALEAMVAIVTNFEELLADLFAGFYTNKPAEQKKYLYVAWLLWSFLRVRMEAQPSQGTRGIYDVLSTLGDDVDIVTFNYTNFFSDGSRPKVRYFHGDCFSYIRFDNRELIRNDEAVQNATDVDSIASFLENLDIDLEKGRAYLPGIVPPLRIKPVICREYLNTWYECGQILDKARAVVIVGYSFNIADEHFNDLLRKGNANTPIVIINPDCAALIPNVTKILGTRPNDLNDIQLGGIQCKRGGRLTFAPVRSEDINESLLAALLR